MRAAGIGSISRSAATVGRGVAGSGWTKFDFASLDPRQKAEFLLLRSEVPGCLDETARAKKRLAEIAPLVPFRTIDPRTGNGPSALGGLGRQAAARKVAELTAAVKLASEHLPKPGGKTISAAVGPPRCRNSVRALQEVLKRVALLLRRISAGLHLVAEETLRRCLQATRRVCQARPRRHCRNQGQGR